MRVGFKQILTICVLCGLMGTSLAQNQETEKDNRYYTISEMEVRELIEESTDSQTTLSSLYQTDPTAPVSRVIGVARDLVALGEDLYRLVIKGKPSNTTSYTPISVLPKVNGQVVDLLDTESWSVPVKRSYEVVYKNYYGMEVVTYKYSIIYSYNGKYDGRGAYLTSVQIIPEYVKTLFGYDFTATMKLGGIQNQGTKKNPIASATILIEYTASTFLMTNLEVSSFHINGKGHFRKL